MNNEVKKYNLPGEKWRQLDKYDDIYSFSNYGRIYVQDHIIEQSNGIKIRNWGKFIQPKKHENGPYYIELRKNEIKESYILWKLIKDIFPELSKETIKESINISADIFMPSRLERQIRYYNLENDKWFDLRGYKGLYQISPSGYIKSLKSKEPQILTPNLMSNGYMKVTLYNNLGQRKTEPIHKLMQMTFLSGYGDRRFVVDHIDGDRTNNHLSNLDTVTYKENGRRARFNREHRKN